MNRSPFIRTMEALAIVLGLALGTACSDPPVDHPPGDNPTTQAPCDPDVEKCEP